MNTHTSILALLAFAVMAVIAAPTWADGEFKCKGERIEKGSSTWGYARVSGSDFRIEKGSSSIGWAKKRSSRFAIETFGSSTLGWLVGDRIEKPNGSTWAKLSDATQMVHDCPDAVAVALWVLKKSGKL